MLKLTPPGRLRRHLGMFASLGLAAFVAGSVYAASGAADPRATTPTEPAATGEYQLDMIIELGSDAARRDPAERTALSLCLEPGKVGTVRLGTGPKPSLTVDARATSEGERNLRVDLAVTAADHGPATHVQVRGALGESLHADGKAQDGANHYALDMIALAGCPARTASDGSATRLMLIDENVQNQPARATAQSIAAKAGLALINPEALDESLVTLNFERIPVERALQLVADIDGKKAVFNGNKVRFENK